VKVRLLVDSAEFQAAVDEDLPQARREVFIQALTFEGDTAGQWIGGLLERSKAADRRMIIDAFSRAVVSDRFIWGPRALFDRELWGEVRAGREILARLGASGAQVRFTNPLGFLFLRGPARNHKKFVLIDGRIAYFGGMNFSEHNFAWRDVMLRVEHEGFTRLLRDDFLTTFAGRNAGLSQRFDDLGLDLHLFDGQTNEARFASLFARLATVRESLVVHCPYVTPPFLEPLLAARRRGVRVTLITPEAHNWSLAGDHAIWACRQGGIDVRLYPGGMTHIKAMLLDERTLVVGSANFDLWSYWFQQEIQTVIEDPVVVADFRTRVLDPDLARSKPCDVVIDDRRGRSLARKLAWLERASLFFNRPTGRGLPPTPSA